MGNHVFHPEEAFRLTAQDASLPRNSRDVKNKAEERIRECFPKKAAFLPGT